jgi:hypothetical protein
LAVDVVSVDGQVGGQPGGVAAGEAAELGDGGLGVSVLLFAGFYLFERADDLLFTERQVGPLQLYTVERAWGGPATRPAYRTCGFTT